MTQRSSPLRAREWPQFDAALAEYFAKIPVLQIPWMWKPYVANILGWVIFRYGTIIKVIDDDSHLAPDGHYDQRLAWHNNETISATIRTKLEYDAPHSKYEELIPIIHHAVRRLREADQIRRIDDDPDAIHAIRRPQTCLEINQIMSFIKMLSPWGEMNLSSSLDLGQSRHADNLLFFEYEQRRCDFLEMSIASVVLTNGDCYRYDEAGVFRYYCLFGEEGPKSAAKRTPYPV